MLMLCPVLFVVHAEKLDIIRNANVIEWVKCNEEVKKHIFHNHQGTVAYKSKVGILVLFPPDGDIELLE